MTRSPTMTEHELHQDLRRCGEKISWEMMKYKAISGVYPFVIPFKNKKGKDRLNINRKKYEEWKKENGYEYVN